MSKKPQDGDFEYPGDKNTWVYHATKAAKTVTKEEADKLKKGEWEDSPAKCKAKAPKNEKKAAKAPKGNTKKSEVKDPDKLEDMGKDQLEAYAKDKFGVDLDKNGNISDFLEEVQLLQMEADEKN